MQKRNNGEFRKGIEATAMQQGNRGNIQKSVQPHFGSPPFEVLLAFRTLKEKKKWKRHVPEEHRASESSQRVWGKCPLKDYFDGIFSSLVSWK